MHIHNHLISNDIVDNFQSAYKTGHSCETALLRMYNDIVTTIGRGNGAMLVLLDLSAAFDTICFIGIIYSMKNSANKYNIIYHYYTNLVYKINQYNNQLKKLHTI